MSRAPRAPPDASTQPRYSPTSRPDRRKSVPLPRFARPADPRKGPCRRVQRSENFCRRGALKGALDSLPLLRTHGFDFLVSLAHVFAVGNFRRPDFPPGMPAGRPALIGIDFHHDHRRFLAGLGAQESLAELARI